MVASAPCGVLTAGGVVSITVMTWPRMLATPSTWAGALTILVMAGMTMISRTLKMLMPKSSRRLEPAASPRWATGRTRPVSGSRFLKKLGSWM